MSLETSLAQKALNRISMRDLTAGTHRALIGRSQHTSVSGGIVDFEDEVIDQQNVIEAERRASLHIELRMPDRHLLVTFREAFLAWLSSRGALFGRVAAASDHLALDEMSRGADAQGMSTLRLSLSWPLGPTIAPSGRTEVQSSRAPTAGSASLTSRDQFVFFPDPSAAAPLYRELPGVLDAQVFRTPPHPPRLTLVRAACQSAVRRVVARGQAADTWIVQRATALKIGGLTVRAPMLARYPRAMRLGSLGAAALAAGFVAGSIYLATRDSPPADSTTVTATPSVTQPAGRSAASAVAGSAASGVTPASPPPIESAANRAAVAEERRPEARVATAPRAPQIPDTEVTTRRGGQNSTSPATLPRRPSVVAVGGVEGTGAATTTRRQGKGSLLVRSVPQGAQVTVNGAVQGRTPLVIRDLAPGSRVVRVELPGYQRWSWAVGITADRQTPVTVKLQPDSRSAGRND